MGNGCLEKLYQHDNGTSGYQYVKCWSIQLSYPVVTIDQTVAKQLPPQHTVYVSVYTIAIHLLSYSIEIGYYHNYYAAPVAVLSVDPAGAPCGQSMGRGSEDKP